MGNEEYITMSISSSYNNVTEGPFHCLQCSTVKPLYSELIGTSEFVLIMEVFLLWRSNYTAKY